MKKNKFECSCLTCSAVSTCLKHAIPVEWLALNEKKNKFVIFSYSTKIHNTNYENHFGS